MENVISETIIKIELSSPGLKKTHYYHGEVSKKKPSDATGYLLDYLQLRENKIQEQEEKNYEEAVAMSQLLKPEDNPALFAEIEEYEVKKQEIIESPTPSFRKLNRKPRKFTIYDYSAIEQEELEERVDQLINSDGFYNEVLPYDHGQAVEKEKSKKQMSNKLLLGLIGVCVVCIVLLVIMITQWFA